MVRMWCDRMLDGLFRGAWTKDVGKFSEHQCIGVVGDEDVVIVEIPLTCSKVINEARCPDIHGKSKVMKEIGTQDSVSHTSDNKNPAK